MNLLDKVREILKAQERKQCKPRYTYAHLGTILLDPRQKKGVPHYRYTLVPRSKYDPRTEDRKHANA